MQQFIILAWVGLLAQLIDGSLGMAYGVTSTTLLLAAGVTPAASSAAVHLSEIGTSFASAISHSRFGNVDWRTVSILALPGALGAFGGAMLLANLDGEVATPWVSGVLMLLGIYVVWRFLALGGQRPEFRGRPSVRFLVPIGLVGGTLDAVGGGGWGPVGTTTLLSSGRLEPRKVVGSIDTSEFVVALGGSAGFLFALGAAGIDWRIAGALLVGGVIAAPCAAWLVRLLPAQVLAIAAGGLIIVTNARTILLGLSAPQVALLATLLSLVAVWVALLAFAVYRERRATSASDGQERGSGGVLAAIDPTIKVKSVTQ